ncbi:hypothetical protein EON82_00875 [bacterium]|nr:MAG: hypothetical protein EON82_00875 [bacterium]
MASFTWLPNAQGVVEVAFRSTALMTIALGLDGLFRRDRVFRQRLWSAVFMGLAIVLLPLPKILVPVAAQQSKPIQPTVYEGSVGTVQSKTIDPNVSRNWLPVLFVAAVAVGLSIFAWRCYRTWRLIRRSEQLADPAVVPMLYDLCEGVGLTEPPLILLSDEIRSPCTTGLWHPVLLWPASLPFDADPNEWRVMLTHELSHLKARDNWRLTVINLVASLYCWNPLVAIGRLRASQVVESSCDSRTLEASGMASDDYARLLLSRQVAVTPGSGLRFWTHGTMHGRVRDLVNPTKSVWAHAALPLLLLPLLPLGTKPSLSKRLDPARVSSEEVVYFGGDGSRQGLYRMWLDGSDQRWISDTFEGASVPSLSPDGRKVAYVKGEGKERDVYMADVTGKGETRVVATPWRDDQPMFSPDGKRLLFITKTPNGWRIGVCDLGSRKHRFLEGDSTKGLEARWHPTGRRILLSSDRIGHQKIWSVNLDGTDPVMLTSGPWEDTGAYYSSDGRYLVYTAYYPWDYNVFTLDLLTGERRQLTDSPALDSEARPTRDGGHILFTTHRTGEPRVAIMNFDGSDQRILSNQIDSSWAAFPGG